MQEQTCSNIHPHIPPQTVVCLKSCCFPMFQQMTVVETVAEVKAAGSVDSSLTTTTESTAKPPPFKDPSFMVSVCVCLVQVQPVSYFLSSVSGFAFFPPFLRLGSTQGLVERQQAKRTGPGRTSNRFWLWSGRYPGSSMIPTVGVCILTHYMLCMFFISIRRFQILDYNYITE